MRGQRHFPSDLHRSSIKRKTPPTLSRRRGYKRQVWFGSLVTAASASCVCPHARSSDHRDRRMDRNAGDRNHPSRGHPPASRDWVESEIKGLTIETEKAGKQVKTAEELAQPHKQYSEPCHTNNRLRTAPLHRSRDMRKARIMHCSKLERPGRTIRSSSFVSPLMLCGWIHRNLGH